MHNIVYLALDHPQFVKECAASIHSLHYKINKNAPEYNVIIYTNLEDAFEKYKLHNLFSVEFITISDSLKQQLLDHTLYTYKLKIWILLDFLQKKKESCIFLDCDTFLIGDISKLFDDLAESKDIAFMNYAEKNIKQLRQDKMQNGSLSLQNKFYHDICDVSHLIVKEKSYQINENFNFWNSGVIGINPHMEKSLQEALSINDYIFHTYKSLTSEQMALSVAFSQDYRILPADHIVYHYWFLKETRHLVEAALELPMEFEKKFLFTPVVELLRQNSKIEYETLEEKAAYFLNQKDSRVVKSLYGTIPSSSYLGQSLRSHV